MDILKSSTLMVGTPPKVKMATGGQRYKMVNYIRKNSLVVLGLLLTLLISNEADASKRIYGDLTVQDNLTVGDTIFWNKLSPEISVATPTLDEVTDEGNTTTNKIITGGLDVTTFTPTLTFNHIAPMQPHTSIIATDTDPSQNITFYAGSSEDKMTFTIGRDELLTLKSDAESIAIGVNKASPSATLHVGGDIKVDTVAATSGENTVLVHKSGAVMSDEINSKVWGSNLLSGAGSSGRVPFYTGSYTLGSESNLFWDSTNNRLGIGIGSPGTALDVRAVGANRINIESTGGGAVGFDMVNPVAHWRVLNQNTGEFVIRDQTVAIKRFVIDESGMVGINTENPESMLHIVSEGGNILDMTRYSDNTYGSGARMSKARGTALVPTAIQTGDTVGQFNIRGYSGSSFKQAARFGAKMDTGTISNTSMPGAFYFNTTPNGTTSAVERMLIRSDGTVEMNYALKLFGLNTSTDNTVLVLNGADDSVGTHEINSAVWGEDIVTVETDPVYSAWDKDYDDLTNKPTLFTSDDLTPTGVIADSSTDLVDSNTIYDAGYITIADIPDGGRFGYELPNVLQPLTVSDCLSIGNNLTVAATVYVTGVVNNDASRFTTGAIIDSNLTTTGGITTKVERLTGGTTLTATQHNVFVDTDSADITINLPAGTQGREYRIANTGSNLVTITPNGAELLLGENTDFVLFDGDVLTIVYEATEGWM